MKAYSLDLRQKIIDVYEQEEISQPQLAKRFNVALSFIVKLLRQYRTTGNILPKPFNGGVKLKLNTENLVLLAELIENNNDATLDELHRKLKMFYVPSVQEHIKILIWRSRCASAVATHLLILKYF